MFIAVTGVSGSGKSTLINDTLFRYVAAELNGANEKPAPFPRSTIHTFARYTTSAPTTL